MNEEAETLVAEPFEAVRLVAGGLLAAGGMSDCLENSPSPQLKGSMGWCS